MKRWTLACCCLVVVATGCGNKEPSAKVPDDSTLVARSPLLAGPQNTVPQDAAGKFFVSGIAWKTPSGWTRVTPANEMRVGEFHTERGDTVTVFAFGQAGGDVMSNVERWKGQFSDIESYSLGSCASTPVPCQSVTIEGVYQGMAGSTASQGKPAQVLHGLIVTAPAGNVFVKAVVPVTNSSSIQEELGALLPTVQIVGS